MGKRRDGASRKSSKSSTLTVSARKSLKLKKSRRFKKNNKNKQNRAEIKHLFQGLRNSLSSISVPSDNSICDNTVIEITNTTAESPKVDPQIPKPGTSKSVMKRKSNSLNSSPIISPKRLKSQKSQTQSVIVINDNENTSNKQPSDQKTIKKRDPIKPFKCSTPIYNKKKSLHDFLNILPNNNTSVVKNFNEEVKNLTREINRDSYLTIDLTKGSTDISNKSKNTTNNSFGTNENTVIDLDNLEEGECETTLDSVNHSKSNTTMSGDSDVTVVHMSRKKKEEKVHKYINRIANLDSSGRVLESVMKKIFTGCNMARTASALTSGAPAMNAVQWPAPPRTPEDTYIKEVILREVPSRNSIGSNIYNPERQPPASGPRMIVIDGSNVAMEHGKGRVFSVKGLKICIDYFLKRGHVVKAFVPRFRCKFGKSTDPRLLDDLERRGLVVYTPSREIQGRLVTAYDDRYIVQCAAEFDGIIVSGDNYRDLMRENPRWQRVIERQLLPFTWVEDMIMFPRDPLGRHGPTLEQFLKHSKPAPAPVIDVR